MKKIVLMMLVAMIPFLTIAQKRSNKNKELQTETVKPIPNVNTKASSFNFDRDTKTITQVVIDKLDCTKENFFCAVLMKEARKKPLIFKAEKKVKNLKPGESKFKSKVAGILAVGKNEYKVELFFNAKEKDGSISFIGNLVIEGSLLDAKESKVMITVKGMQK